MITSQEQIIVDVIAKIPTENIKNLNDIIARIPSMIVVLSDFSIPGKHKKKIALVVCERLVARLLSIQVSEDELNSFNSSASLLIDDIVWIGKSDLFQPKKKGSWC